MMKYLIIALSVTLIIASCSKKTTPVASMQETLRNGHWTVANSSTIRQRLPNGKDTTLNYLNFVPKCHQDDYLVFHNNNIDGAIMSGSTKCSPADPDSVTFKWNLTNNNNTMSLYGGFDFIYAAAESIVEPFQFDTSCPVCSHNPLVLDTILGVLDSAAGFYRVLIRLDTIWNLRFDSTSVRDNDIYNAPITNFSQNAFTINFWIYGTYPDSTNFHTGMNIFPGPPIDTVDRNPIIRADTFFYSITYHN